MQVIQAEKKKRFDSKVGIAPLICLPKPISALFASVICNSKRVISESLIDEYSVLLAKFLSYYLSNL